MDTATNWVALAIAILYYRDIGVDTALKAAQGQTRLSMCNTLNVSLVRSVLSSMSRDTFKNLDKLSRRTRIAPEQLATLYGICDYMHTEDETMPRITNLTDAQIQYAIEKINNGYPMYKLHRELGCSYERLKYLCNIPDRPCNKTSDTAKEQDGYRATAAARKYISKFATGDTVLVQRIGWHNKPYITTGRVASTTPHMLTVSSKGETISVSVADIVSKWIKIKHKEG